MNALPGTFSWTAARQLAAAAAQAYTQSTVADPRTNARALVSLDADGDVIAAFKGSSSPRDFLQDAKFLLRPAGGNLAADAFVHAGFLEDFRAIASATLDQLRAQLAAHTRARLYLTGHSLGGALATLIALECRRRHVSVAGVYTFGQPRTGNIAFHAIYNSLLYDYTYRLVHQNDLVPRTPSWLFGYRHCGQEMFLPVGGGAWLNPALPRKIISDALGFYSAYRQHQDVLLRDHFLQAYRNAIATQAAPAIQPALA